MPGARYGEAELTFEKLARGQVIVRDGMTRAGRCVAAEWLGVDVAMRCPHQVRWLRSGKYPVCGQHALGRDLAYIPEADWTD